MTLGLAAAGAVTLSALPVGILATSHSGSRLQPVRAAYSATLDEHSTPTPTATSAENTDGSTIAAKLARDDKLRRTLLALRKQAAASKSVTGKGLSPAAVSARSVVVGGSVADIPAIALTAYRRAAQRQSAVDPSCHVPWSLLAGIGRVESSHGQYGGSQPDASGVVHPSILGPLLDGSGGTAAISDTDGGRYDGDTRWDRAVGPMQFIPSSWATGGRDGNGDGVRDPENLFDAALAAANYLCASGGDLRTTSAAERAVLTYNHSWDYVLVVLGYAASYANQDLSAITTDVAQHAIKPLRKVSGTGLSRPAAAQLATPTKRATARPLTPANATPSPAPTRAATPAPTRAPGTPSPIPTTTPTTPASDPTIVVGPPDGSSTQPAN